MESNNLNNVPCNVTGTSRIIFVKECINESINNESECRIVCSTPRDERIIVSPLNLEETSSINSLNSEVSLPANQQLEEEQRQSFTNKLLCLIKGNSFPFLGVLAICILSFVSITLIPYHNVILHPAYWYESIFIQSLGTFPSCLGVFIIQVGLFVNNQAVTRPSTFIKVTLLWAAFCAIGHILVHLLWSVCLGFNSPIPFSLLINITFTLVPSTIVLWSFLPKSFKTNTANRDRFKAYICYVCWVFLVPDVVSIISETVHGICNFTDYDIKWTIAVVLLLFKQKSISIMEKYITKVALPENISFAKGLVTIENGIMFKSIILLLIASKTDVVTGHWFIGLSVLYNIKMCVRIIKLHKQKINNANQNGISRKRKKKMMTTLMLNEASEFFTTIAHVLATFIAYYGPNAGLIGNIKNHYWQMGIIDSFSNFLGNISYSILMDISCGVITLIVLWVSCNINGLLFFKYKIGRFAHAMAFCISREINFVSF